MKKIVLTGLVALIFLGFALSLKDTDRNDSNDKVQKQTDKPALLAPNSRGNPSSIPQDFLEENNRKAMAAYNELKSDLQLKTASPKEVYIESIEHLESVSKKFNRELIYKTVFDELSADEGKIVMASKSLIDNGFAQDEFGENQALMRVFAIKLLKHEAVKGNLGPLIETINELKTNLNLDSYQIKKGQLRDLEDLISVFVRLKGGEEVLANMESTLEEMGYFMDEIIKPEISEVYDDAIYLSLQRSVDRKVLAKTLEKYFD